MAKKPVKLPSKIVKKEKESVKITCEICKINQVSKERCELIGQAVCLECAGKDNSEMMAVQECDKDGTVEMNLVDSKTFYTYSKNAKNFEGPSDD
jgi:hypothetical protein